MVDYNFENFDDYEFEILCRELLNEENKIHIKSNHGLDYEHILSFSNFKRGKDEGVDLYFEDGETSVVGQVKLSRGKFSDLFYSLKRKVKGINELSKVKKLNPSKYIFMTSVPMSLANKKKLIEYFSPFIISLNDIYGREDLNRLLSKYSRIEKKFVKLYFSNSVTLERLLNNATLTRSNFTVEEIKSQIKYFVQTKSFSKALSIIEKSNVLIIKGLPGVGKTTLAKILSFYFIEKGYTFIEILTLDSEIERLIDSDECPYVFYYDDFLGANSFVLSDSLRNEGRLNKLLRRISNKSDKALIMTSRTNIINTASYRSDKLKRAFHSISKFEVDASALNYYEKGKILDNHLQRNSFKKSFFEKEFRKKIIGHKNFSPRLIEHVTDRLNYELNENDYKEFVISSLNDPSEIWDFAYNHQIDYKSRIYLNHLFLFGGGCEHMKFKNSFNRRLDFEVLHNNFLKQNNEFKECTTILDGTFITINRNRSMDNESFIEFINPSVGDFLIKEIRNNLELIKGSVSCFDDGAIIWIRFNHHKRDLLEIFNLSELKKLFLNESRLHLFKNNIELIKYFETLIYYFEIREIAELFSNQIESLVLVGYNEVPLEVYCGFMIKYREFEVVSDTVRSNADSIYKALLNRSEYEGDFIEVNQFFKCFSIESYLSLSQNQIDNLRKKTIERVLKDSVKQFIHENCENILSYNDVEIFYEFSREVFKKRYLEYGHIEGILVKILDSQNWQHLIEYHKFKYAK
ncbi:MULTISPECIES: hypothetical protein [Leeuwenhoekiella]|jgi:DNA polymerase III delta prime subunit|uniref:nSTAND3 domain-containing NTPase n=1 Tax=Leeuwenhoekiella TaxID=283735 RepID=UPI000C4AA875|nr:MULTISPECIES: hypothetical protein [Leeuwenhoekiella]MAO43249.1 hypothetical protein [Leeuwenhoekiella sp.]HBT08564.1 hypothetical protein [Leeuwenhoekiella sp.]|tara:strand:- start:126 stop:2363 length:2238 start_codon:yes stop_codon:yes gene_type:complete